MKDFPIADATMAERVMVKVPTSHTFVIQPVEPPWDVIRKIAEESGIKVSEDQLCPPGIDLGNPKTWKVQE